MRQYLKNSVRALFERGSYPQLDILRGIAALLVFVSHIFRTSAPNHAPALYIKFLNFSGHAGVELFFVLSGFLITLPFWKALKNGQQSPNTSRYFKNRFLRILPLYYISTTLFFFLYLKEDMLHKSQVGEQIVSYIFLYMNFIKEFNTVNSPTWSVAVELHFYLLVPLFFYLLRKYKNSRWAIVWVFVILISTYRFMTIYLLNGSSAASDTFRNFFYANSFSRLFDFAFGIIASYCFIFQNTIYHTILSQRKLFFVVGVACAMFSILQEADSLLDDKVVSFVPMAIQSILIPLGWSLIMISSLQKKVDNSFNISSSTFAFVGKISFSLYLLHLPIFMVLSAILRTRLHFQLDTVAGNFIYLLIITMISVGSFIIIEYPFLRKKTSIVQSTLQPV